MRYLTLTADYTESPLRDDFTGSLVPEEVGVPWELGDRLRSWNDRYRAVIPLGPDERNQADVLKLISELDTEGLGLVSEVAAAVGDAKIRYFSEGHLRYLS
ncbi:MAG: hypothetical protein F2772_11390 [Actinobacteria bacterium]|uniref:Unannotated protein n=1 Tax=freshwater metagenome TaxID=449393 RepID=A0A6J7C3U9_9ZZZZ|nr:hypothetical protein [Actinomycetota bacterium]MSX56123.1 hypothetical protein [Actinomycetota bacterium]MTB17863.1 hypothetical protein [Actinomycetota bacterium]